eukprot:scaffold104979_cov28-Tisochrysis_lutea.AAC.1
MGHSKPSLTLEIGETRRDSTRMRGLYTYEEGEWRIEGEMRIEEGAYGHGPWQHGESAHTPSVLRIPDR